jgi:hypothetical protein
MILFTFRFWDRTDDVEKKMSVKTIAYIPFKIDIVCLHVIAMSHLHGTTLLVWEYQTTTDDDAFANNPSPLLLLDLQTRMSE